MTANADNEREDRALDALIVSHLLREREMTDLDDLPELSDSQRVAMNALPADFIESLWNEADDSAAEGPDCHVEFSKTESDEELFVGMNRAEEMDEDTKRRLDEARREVIDLLRLGSIGKFFAWRAHARSR